jgi:predicted HicB family RNase H-like nuclease
MAKKKSETRKHTAMIRVDLETREKAALAASLMRVSLADYASRVLGEAADADVKREAKKLAGPPGKG